MCKYGTGDESKKELGYHYPNKEYLKWHAPAKGKKGGPKTSDMKKIFGVSDKHGSTKDIKLVVFGDGGKVFNPFKGK